MEDENGKWRVERYGDIKVMYLDEPSQAYLDKLKIDRELSKRPCRYCGGTFYPEEILAHEPDCRRATFQRIKTVEDRLSFIARELGLV